MQNKETSEMYMGDGVETPTAKPLPRYRCHKEVSALKIAGIKHGQFADGSAEIVPAEEGFLPFRVSRAYMLMHAPRVGGYFVMYVDGHQSFSPPEAFELGYTRI